VLPEGAACVQTIQPGYDICGRELECTQVGDGSGSTCQYPNYDLAFYDDVSS